MNIYYHTTHIVIFRRSTTLTYDIITIIAQSIAINIITCNQFAKTLKILIAANTKICDDGLCMCKNIKILNASNNDKITSCDPFAHNLVILYANSVDSVISDQGIKCCVQLKKLYANDNNKITTCKPSAHTSRYLSATGQSCGISNSGLAHCYKLKTLHAGSNDKINIITHFLSLKLFTYTFSNPSMQKEINTLKKSQIQLQLKKINIYR